MLLKVLHENFVVADLANDVFTFKMVFLIENESKWYKRGLDTSDHGVSVSLSGYPQIIPIYGKDPQSAFYYVFPFTD